MIFYDLLVFLIVFYVVIPTMCHRFFICFYIDMIPFSYCFLKFKEAGLVWGL